MTSKGNGMRNIDATASVERCFKPTEIWFSWALLPQFLSQPFRGFWHARAACCAKTLSQAFPARTDFASHFYTQIKTSLFQPLSTLSE